MQRTHYDWLAMSTATVEGPRLTADDVLLNPFPMVNMAGINGMFLPWLRVGGLLVQHHPFDLPTFLRQIGQYRATYTVAPPALLTALLHNDALLAQADISSLRVLGSGSAPLAPSLLQGWHDKYGLEILNFYGSNEGVSLLGTAVDIPDPAVRALYFPRYAAPGRHWSFSIARWTQARIVDPATGKEITEAGVPGELQIKGPAVFPGYLPASGVPDPFEPDGYLKTGDILEIAGDELEYLHYVDRSKDMVVRGGMKISAAEIETLVSGHPKVADVAVVGYPDEVLGERTCVIVVRGPGRRSPWPSSSTTCAASASPPSSCRNGWNFATSCRATRRQDTQARPARGTARGSGVNEGNGMTTQARTVADMIRRNAAAIPASPAVVGEGRNVTYGELGERSDRIASGLVAAGLRTGDRVAYLARNATEYWELFFGAAKAAVAVVPLNFRLAAGEIEWILGDAEPSAIVVEEHLTGLVPDHYDGLRLVFSQAGTPADKPGWFALEDWLARQPPADPHREAGGDGLLTLMYSSGTTGRPKGVTTTVEAMVWAVDAFGAQFGPSRDMVSLVPTPYYHIAAGGWSLISLNAGGQIVQFTEVTPANLLELMVSARRDARGDGADADPAVHQQPRGVGRRLLQRALPGLRRLADLRDGDGQGARGVRRRPRAELRADGDDRRHHASCRRRTTLRATAPGCGRRAARCPASRSTSSTRRPARTSRPARWARSAPAAPR